MQPVFHRETGQRSGHERGQYDEPPGTAADAEPQGRQQRARSGHRGHREDPWAVVSTGVAQRHEQRSEDRTEEVPPVVREHAHDDQQPQHHREDGTSAQVESLPLYFEQFLKPSHVVPLSGLLRSLL